MKLFILTIGFLAAQKDLSFAQESLQEHPYTLPKLMERAFNGHDLKLDHVLDRKKTYTRYYITYRSDSLTISGIMNIPVGKGPFPVLILNHGYIPPKVYTNGRGLKREQDYLARAGYAVLHPDYRNHAYSDKDEDNDLNFRAGYVIDVINAIEAVKSSELKMLDKNNIGMLGHSMGGMLATFVIVVKPKLVKAVVLYAPSSGNYAEVFDRWISGSDLGDRMLAKFQTARANPALWKQFSAYNYVDNISASISIHHGTNDKSVPVAWSNNAYKIFKEAGKDVSLHLYQNEKHEFISQWNEFMVKTEAFFSRHLRAKSAK